MDCVSVHERGMSVSMTIMSELGCVMSEHDYYLYMLQKKDEIIYLIIFVDDLVICCKNRQNLALIKSLLKKRF